MAICDILQMGNPLLYKRSEEIIHFDTPELDELIGNMFDTMADSDGAGLAAPQIGVLQRLVIFSVESNPRYPDAETVPRTILINPEIEVLDDERESGWEGCLSIPGMRGVVSRPSYIRYSGFNEKGEKFSREVRGFHARVVQHECDHLDGVLYPMRIKDIRQFGYESALF
ncbi:MAG: peptide deformylase, partial [Gammaproteobacteria bacterium]|nr:peptide deformylase [Gammaproteobacteria bacterium]